MCIGVTVVVDNDIDANGNLNIIKIVVVVIVMFFLHLLLLYTNRWLFVFFSPQPQPQGSSPVILLTFIRNKMLMNTVYWAKTKIIHHRILQRHNIYWPSDFLFVYLPIFTHVTLLKFNHASKSIPNCTSECVRVCFHSRNYVSYILILIEWSVLTDTYHRFH